MSQTDLDRVFSSPHSGAGHRAVAERGTILRTQVGSGVHGVTVADDDRDEMGICIEPPEYVIGLRRFEQYEYRTQPQGVRSGKGDLDLTVYSLRKWLRLALQGNPTVLLPLFVPESEVVEQTDVGRFLRAHPELVLSRRAGHRFIGYLRSQRARLLGLRGRHTNRPELVDAHGFDCYLDDTEFLTRRGWLDYDAIDDADELATVDRASGQVEFQRPTERIAKPYTGPILTSRTRYSEWAVTPNHRMRVSKSVDPRAYDADRAEWTFRPAAEVARLDWFQQVAAVRNTNDFPVSDAHLALVGAYLSAGTVGQRRKDGRADVDVVDELAKSCGEGIDKRLPDWAFALSGRQADLMIRSLLDGQGTPLRSGGWVHHTNSKRLAGDVQAVAILAGRRTTVHGPHEHGPFQVLIHDTGDVPYAAFRGRDVTSVEVVDRRIVCFTVPNETLVTRRNGRVAMHGNTKFAYHMVRLGVQGVELLSTGRITLPMPQPWLTELRALRRGERTREWALAAAE
jgi:hypothetical protein